MRMHRKPIRAQGTAETIRARVESGGERLWRLVDFPGLPATAAAKALSRLRSEGVLERVGKGLYYRARRTAFGPSRLSPVDLRALVQPRSGLFPAGIAAANLLGFTTQNPPRIELAAAYARLPRACLGHDVLVHVGRPAAWRMLTEIEAALLDFLRTRGASSELSPEETVERLLQHLRAPGRFERLLKVASSEPPRVRAMLGALGEQLGRPTGKLAKLRQSLNPLSRFEFGILAGLAHARRWQAKERPPHAPL